MRTYSILNSFNSLECLELKLSPTALSIGGLVAAPVVTAHLELLKTDDDPGGDDPPPEPEPQPPPFPGPNPPVGWPPVPPSGPAGPG
jgi:hypothetical protein